MLNGVVCVVAFNREKQLIELLSQLDNIRIPLSLDVKFILSIDYSSIQKQIIDKVKEQGFVLDWELVSHPSNLGLKKHILYCGDLVLKEDYDFILILEDDLKISPYVLDYISTALPIADCNDEVAGLSLYGYKVSEADYLPFMPNEDGFDNYYLQYPSSWGQVWSRKMWLNFKTWLTSNDCLYFYDDRVPDYVCGWSHKSWKKHFIRYMIDENKYFLFPRVSLTSNDGVNGTHHVNIGHVFKVPILMGEKNWNISHYINSKSKYNAWFEIDTKNRTGEPKQRAHNIINNFDVGLKVAFYIFLKALVRKAHVLWGRN